MCLVCPKEQKKSAGWWGVRSEIHMIKDARILEICSDKQEQLSRFWEILHSSSCWLFLFPWSPISVTSEVNFQGSDSTMSTLIHNRTSEYGAKCFLPSNSQIAGLRPNGGTIPLLVTCRCILKNDSRKNDINTHKHKPSTTGGLRKVPNLKNCWVAPGREVFHADMVLPVTEQRRELRTSGATREIFKSIKSFKFLTQEEEAKGCNSRSTASLSSPLVFRRHSSSRVFQAQPFGRALLTCPREFQVSAHLASVSSPEKEDGGVSKRPPAILGNSVEMSNHQMFKRVNPQK